MSAQDDMKAAIASLTTAVAAENAKVDDLVAQFAANAKSAGMDDATVESFVKQIQDVTSTITAKLDAAPTATATIPTGSTTDHTDATTGTTSTGTTGTTSTTGS